MSNTNSKSKLVFVIGVMLIATLLLASCAQPATPAPAAAPALPSAPEEMPAPVGQAEITLPFVGPLTGPDGVDGQGASKAVELAVNLTNEAGGVCGGTQLKFEAHDTKADPKEGANIATMLCSNQNVLAAVADYNSSVALAEASIFNECGLPQINYYAAAPEIPKRGGPYTFRIYPPGNNMSIYLADWVANVKGFQKVAVLYENTDYGLGLYEAFVEAIKDTDSEIIAAEAVLKEQVDLSAVISKFKSLGPDVVVGMLQYQVGAYWATQARDLDLNAPLYGSDGLFAPEIIVLGGDAVEGVRTVAAYTTESTDPVIVDFVTAYNAAYGENPNNPAGYAFDVANTIIQSLNETNCSGRDDIQKWFSTEVKEIKGVTGVISLDEDGDRTFAPGMYTPIEIKDGEWVEVKE
jgi:branched-chain amino acid transport system substrate-binding protein